MPTRTLPTPFFAVFNADTLAAKQAWKAAGGTHVVVAARWSALEPTQDLLSSTELAAIKQQLADAGSAGLGVIWSFSTHYAPTWAQTAGVKYRNQAGVDWTGVGSDGNKVIDTVFSASSRTLVSSFMSRVWAELTAPEKALIQGWRVGGGPFGELHYPNTGDWWAYSAPAQASCPVPGHIPFVAYANGGLLSVNAFGIETSAAAWEAAATGLAVTRSTVKASSGTASLSVVQSGSTNRPQARLAASERPSVAAGQQVTVRVDGTNASSGRTGAVGIEWYAGTTLLSTSWGPDTALSSTEWRPMSATAVAPAAATKFGVIAGLSPNAAASSQEFLLDRFNAFIGSNPDVQFTEWYLDAQVAHLAWQVQQVRALFDGSIHVLMPGFGLRSNFSYGSSNYIQQAAEGLDWTRQVTGLPDAEVHPQATWANQTDPWDPEQDQVFVVDSDKASWRKLLEVATDAGRAQLLGGENTGGSDPNWDDNSDVDFMFGPRGAYAEGRYAGLTWLNYPRLAGEVAGTHATLAHLSSYIPDPVVVEEPDPVHVQVFGVAPVTVPGESENTGPKLRVYTLDPVTTKPVDPGAPRVRIYALDPVAAPAIPPTGPGELVFWYTDETGAALEAELGQGFAGVFKPLV